ncbi:MAG: hypothetical protein RQ763_10705, partial [Sulfurimonas sp.]|uniref:hypothetical protein n=1 Tax=Sulfurimonas sp. TaxID=2022749 RepID=UPI0028CF67DC
MKTTNMKFLALLLALLFSSHSLQACCGCAIVEVAMKDLNATVQKSIKAMDGNLSLFFDQTVLKDTNDTMKEANLTVIDLNQSVEISKQIDLSLQEINFLLEQSI